MIRKKRVLIAVGSLGVGGNEIFVMNILRSINYQAFVVDLLVFDDSRLDFYEEAASYGCQIFMYHGQENMRQQMKFVSSVLKEQPPYDVVHVHSCSFNGLLRGTIPAKRAGVKNVISHSHNSGTPKNNFVDRTLRLCMKRRLQSSITYGLSCSDLAGESKYTEAFIASDKYKVIHNAIVVGKYLYRAENRDKIRTQYGIQDRVVIGNVGRLANQKNQAYLIQLLPELLKRNPAYCVMIVGGGELEAPLKEQVKIMGLENSVVFTGNVHNANEYYSAMDVYVMPSLYEGLPFTVVEAQVNGLKCVLSDQISRMCNISGDVEFLSLSDPDSWVEAIATAAESRSDSENTQRVVNDYDLSKEIKVLEAFYQA